MEAALNALSAAELGALFGHFLVLSLLAVGGAITTASDMQRYLVHERGWLSDADFTASVALAQAAPGPNVLFVAVLGWNAAGAAGAAAALAGIMLPSTTLTLWATRWGGRYREARGVRAFVAGLAPITIGLLLATGWVLTDPMRGSLALMAIVAATAAAILRWQPSPVWLVGAGMIAGVLGWV